MSDDLTLATRSGLPDALTRRLADHPRDAWRGHPGFAGLVSFWLEKHGMFRKLDDLLRQDTQARIDGRLDPDEHLRRLSRFGGMLVGDLHGHHQIEDHHYFPQLLAAAPDLARGFEMLDADHHALDSLLADFTDAANAVLTGQGEPGPFLDALDRFSPLLIRHLDDEENLIVPVLLDAGGGA
jgi:hemerythrin-like domain-containing protein